MKRRNFLQALGIVSAAPILFKGVPISEVKALTPPKKERGYIQPTNLEEDKCNVLPDVPCILFKDKIEIARGRAVSVELQPIPFSFSLNENTYFKRPSRSIIKCEFPANTNFFRADELLQLEMYVGDTNIFANVIGEEVSVTNMSMDDMKVKYIITFIVSGEVRVEEV